MKFRISLGKGFFPLLFSSLLMILCLVGCAEDSNILNNGKSRQLEFSVTTHNWSDSANSNKSSDQKIPSRATPISTFDTSKNFNVIADENKSGIWSTEVNNETASYSSTNNIWQITATHYWPGTGSTVNFYFYYPTSISGSITHNTGSAPVLSYTVPYNAADQIDILASSKTGVAGDSYSQTPVDFKHIFAAVQFSVGTAGLPEGTISSITINGIKNSGTYTFGNGWTLNSGMTTFKVSPSTAINGTSGEGITSGAYTLMMIPQTFNNATITLTYNTGTAYTKTISGTWDAGNTYTYNLSKPVNIGDYYYSDGTWGTIMEHNNSTAVPIGVIFSNSTSNIDKGHGWTHGYAMALQNAGSATSTYQWYTSESGNPTGTYIAGVDNIMSDKDGYTHSGYLQTLGYAAGIAARGYTAKDKNGNTVTDPSCSSGWYLPSCGQWYDICVNLGGMATVSGKFYTNSGTNWLRWYSGDDGSVTNYSSLCESAINVYLNILLTKGYSVDLFSNDYEVYWSSSEYNSSWVYSIYFLVSDNVTLGYNGSGKTSSANVRPVAAF
ncbi:MAG: fimbrillin family protein [Prevotella sp.]|jgi:hypothetical protein|nr:fimbrillin family protein [Prevotella sp.]